MPKVEVAENLKRPQSAYFLWLNANRALVEKEAGGKTGPLVSKKAGEMWKALPEKEQKVYQDQYKKAKETYDAYLKTDEGAAAMQGLKEQKKEQKEDNLKKEAKKAAKSIEKDEKLKKPASAYWRWMSANRAKIEAAAGSKSPAAVGSKAGEMWKVLSASEKKPYEDEAAKAKKEYDDYVNSEEGKAALNEYKTAAKEAKTAILGAAPQSRKRKAEEVAGA
mmetsp:Transcript_90309/g.170245  ORF Transcript_90309/g.170245 Transcript_90309/m.170245 type:complete len:221 (-) Transcript_90309:197-859(-)